MACCGGVSPHYSWTVAVYPPQSHTAFLLWDPGNLATSLTSAGNIGRSAVPSISSQTCPQVLLLIAHQPRQAGVFI